VDSGTWKGRISDYGRAHRGSTGAGEIGAFLRLLTAWNRLSGPGAPPVREVLHLGCGRVVLGIEVEDDGLPAQV
jgi:hypothetical protein